MRTGSAIGASRVLNISQPTVSKMLQHAEQRLGFALFIRSKGRLVPTPEALRLQQELNPFDDHLARIRRVVVELATGAAAPFRLAATPAIAHHLAPRAIALWCKAYPESKLIFSASHTREMVYALLLNEIDIGLTMQPVSHPNILTTLVRECEVYAIAPKGWWPARILSKPLQPEELAGQPFISIDSTAHLGATVNSWLEGVTPPPDVRVSVQTYTLARSLVEAKIGVAVVDSFTAKAGGMAADIQVRKIDLPVQSNIYSISNRSRPPPKTADFLIDAVLKLPE